MDKSVIILRAVSGSGKSTFAEFLRARDPENTVVCTADDFFNQPDGTYRYDASKIHEAHRECKLKFVGALFQNTKCIIVANTNTTEKEFGAYAELAKDCGYNIVYLVLENRHGNNDIHNVPSEHKKGQKERLARSIQL